MVDDVRPLIQVVHVVAAVIATVTKHQLQHQVLWEQRREREGDKDETVRKVGAMATLMSTASWRVDVARRYSITPCAHTPQPPGTRNACCASPLPHFSCYVGQREARGLCLTYLYGPLLLAHVVGLQLLRLWQRSADGRP